MEYIVKEPTNCSEVEINSFLELSKKSNQVALNGLKERIQNTFLLGFCYHNEDLIGISSIKTANTNYINGVFEKSKVAKEASKYKYELGYSFTLETYRGKGINCNLNKELIKAYKGKLLFATTGNDKMKNILSGLGFKTLGNEYDGTYNDILQLFVYKC